MNAGGGVGGNFAPSLFIGGFTGYWCVLLAGTIGFDLPVAHFVLAGMAGCLSGIFLAPLTALFLIAEITGGYNLMIPLMIVSSVSFFIARTFDPLKTRRIHARSATLIN
jgi:CIC family chloride channel protein